MNHPYTSMLFKFMQDLHVHMIRHSLNLPILTGHFASKYLLGPRQCKLELFLIVYFSFSLFFIMGLMTK